MDPVLDPVEPVFEAILDPASQKQAKNNHVLWTNKTGEKRKRKKHKRVFVCCTRKKKNSFCVLTAIEQFTNLEETTLDETIGRVKTFEERVNLFNGSLSDNQDKLLFTNHDNSSRHEKGFKNGRQEKFTSYQDNKQYGKTKQFNNENKPSHKFKRNKFQKGTKDSSKVKCYNCNKFGHVRRNCKLKDKGKEQSNMVQEDVEPTLLMAVQEKRDKGEKIFLNEKEIKPKKHISTDESLWYLDNGASNHMTGMRTHFKEVDEKISGRVRFGDGSYVKIKGKGSILLECKNKEQIVIPNVDYIPNLKSNILSLGQLTKNGYDCTRYMWVYFLKSKDEAFETFKECKLKVENEVGKKLKSFRTDRGGEFISREFTRYCKENGILRQLTSPYSLKQNGIVERRNRSVMSTTRSMLKAMHMPQNFWAEATRHAVYVLNRVATKALKDSTPYEALKGRKPNMRHLRVFGCKAYVKVTKPHLKKLDDRSRELVYLGTKPRSNAYRLFDPVTKDMIVSRYVKFKEDEGWGWKVSTQDSERSDEDSEPSPKQNNTKGDIFDDDEIEQPIDNPSTPPPYTYEPNSEGLIVIQKEEREMEVIGLGLGVNDDNRDFIISENQTSSSKIIDEVSTQDSERNDEDSAPSPKQNNTHGDIFVDDEIEQPIDNPSTPPPYTYEPNSELFSVSQGNRKKCHMLPAKSVLYDSSNVKLFALRDLVHSRFAFQTNLLLSRYIRTFFDVPMNLKLLSYGFRVPEMRKDGWVEVNVWEFSTDTELKDVPMTLKLLSYGGTMRGLILNGIEFRPM
nr:zinc finger, CCHC-type [Tanacetum cinerariifolium]